MRRFFTHEQAGHLIPEVERLLRAAISTRGGLIAAGAELEATKAFIQTMGGVQPDLARLLSLKRRLEGGTESLRGVLDQIAEIGVHVKDLDAGLVDFPTLYHGREVLLCWRLGEPGISSWHGLEEGFRGRKKIDHEFLANHAGNASH